MKGSGNLASFLFGFFAQTSGKTGQRKDTQRWRFELLVGFSRSSMQSRVRLLSGGGFKPVDYDLSARLPQASPSVVAVVRSAMSMSHEVSMQQYVVFQTA